MRKFLIMIAMTLPFSAAHAESDASHGADLVQEGMKLLFQSFADELAPALEEIGPKLQELGPQFEMLRDKIGDFSAYELPEVLPNGDILIRKKQPAPEDGEIDL
ncbi:MAG: hypothetical protein ABI459_10260 [Deltaproteobacteria bacterium]